MSGNFHENLATRDVPLPSERSTGLVFAAVGLILAVVWRGHIGWWVPALVAASGFAGLALLAPHHLKTLNVLWFKLGQLLHMVVSPLIMGLMYAIAIVPLGLVMQRFRDPLKSRPDPASTTYWVARNNAAASPMTEQF